MTATFEDWCTHYGYEPADPDASADYRRYLAGLDVFGPQTEAKLDWLAERALTAVAAHRPELAGHWIEEKRRDLAGRTRMQVFQWMNNLDRGSRVAIAKSLGIDPDRFEIALDVSRSL